MVKKGSKIRLLVSGIHALTGIAHVDPDVVAGREGESLGPRAGSPLGEMLGADSDRQGAGLVTDCLAPVDHQVHDQLLELGPVGFDRECSHREHR